MGSGAHRPGQPGEVAGGSWAGTVEVPRSDLRCGACSQRHGRSGAGRSRQSIPSPHITDGETEAPRGSMALSRPLSVMKWSAPGYKLYFQLCLNNSKTTRSYSCPTRLNEAAPSCDLRSAFVWQGWLFSHSPTQPDGDLSAR